jgi:hypothetical protein
VEEYGIKLGTALLTMVEPHRGHEVEYNRWYERDHFYAGCMVGAWQFAGRRFVCPRPYKDLRWPREANPITPDPMVGSYIAVYWVLAGHHDEWNAWAVDQVNWLHANGRMFPERDHIHTLLYQYEWSERTSTNGPSAELALDHHYPGMVMTVGEAAEGVDRAEVAAWYREEHLPPVLAEGAVDLVLGFSPLPLLGNAPSDVPRTEGNDRRFTLLWFLNRDPLAVWPSTFADHGAELAKSGLALPVWASPFIPTVVGTDTYTDQLW